MHCVQCLLKLHIKLLAFIYIFFFSSVFHIFSAAFSATCTLFIEVKHDAHCTLHTSIQSNPCHSQPIWKIYPSWIAYCNIMYDVRNMSAPLHTMHFGCNMQLFVRWIFFSFSFLFGLLFFSAAVDGERARVWLSFAWYETYTWKCSAGICICTNKMTLNVQWLQWCNDAMRRRIGNVYSSF